MLRLFSRLNIGGPSFHVILLSTGLDARGYDTRLVVGTEGPREGNLLDLAEERGLRCHRLDGLEREIRPVADLRALASLYHLIREFRPQIVHTHTAKAGVLGRLAARMAGVPVVVHTYHGHVLRGYFGPVKSAAFRVLERALGGATDAVVTVSDAVADDLDEMGVARRDRTRVVPLGLELEALAGPLPRGVLRGEAGFPAAAPLVGIVGRLVPIKDVSQFLRAAAGVASARPEVRFAVVGDGEERARLEAEAAALGIAKNVCFHGWRRDLAAVYGDLDLVVNCSRNEGTPVALIEALAAGRRIVATRVGGTPDVLANGRYGRLVPTGDLGALREAILGALDDPLVAESVQEARTETLRRFSIDRLLNDIDGLYRELLSRRGAA